MKTPVDKEGTRTVTAISTHPPGFATIMGRKILHTDGHVVLNSSVREATRSNGLWRVTVEDSDGDRWSVSTRALVTCGGGFSNNLDYMTKFMRFDPQNVWARNSGYSVGTALDIALANGGHWVGGMHTFYGHCLPAPPARFLREDFAAVSQNYGGYTAALNMHGRRFVDESACPPPYEEDISQAVAHQPGGNVYYIFDEAIYRTHVAGRLRLSMPERDLPDKLETARESGGPVWSAQSLPELVTRMGDAFSDPAAALTTLEEYSAAALAGKGESLSIPKSGGPDYAIPLVKPPFYAVGVRAGVTLTMGGVAVDVNAQVLNDDNSPIPGLFAAGADIGNIHNFHYVGGNAIGLVFGRIAGTTAAAFARTIA
jgi:succinate dehydrogenase/fumarate reductase flavoprotein subunit